MPSELRTWFGENGFDKFFITTMDRKLARLYPIPVWKSTAEKLEKATVQRDKARDLLFGCKVYGGDSGLDTEGRVLLPSKLRKELALEKTSVYLDVTNDFVNIRPKSEYDAQEARSLANMPQNFEDLSREIGLD